MNVGVYYNKKMFKEVGIVELEFLMLEKLWIWDEFNMIVKKLKDYYNKLVIDFCINLNDEMLLYVYMLLIWLNNGFVVNEDGIKVEGYFNLKESVEVV